MCAWSSPHGPMVEASIIMIDSRVLVWVASHFLTQTAQTPCMEYYGTNYIPTLTPLPPPQRISQSLGDFFRDLPHSPPIPRKSPVDLLHWRGRVLLRRVEAAEPSQGSRGRDELRRTEDLAAKISSTVLLCLAMSPRVPFRPWPCL